MKKLLLMAISALLFVPAFPAGAASPVLLGAHRFQRVHRPYFSGSWRWGWGWGYPAYYGPYYGPYGPYSRYEYARAEWAAVKTDVSPEEARVYLDDKYIGTADDFDGWPDNLYLKRGHYRLEFRLEGYESQSVDVEARPGTKVVLNNELRKIPGAKQYGSYDTPRIEGGIRRYWAKRRDVAEAVPPYSAYGDDERDRYDRDRGDLRRRDEDRDRGLDSRREEERERRRQEPDEWRGNRRTPDTTVRAPESAGERARLLLRVRPSDAAVYLDDRFIGTAEEVNAIERGVPVSPGKHTVTISRPGFKDRSKNVEVQEGRSERLELDLER